LDSRLIVLSDGHDAVANMDSLLSGCGRVWYYSFYNDVRSFHPQNDTNTAIFVASHPSGTLH